MTPKPAVDPDPALVGPVNMNVTPYLPARHDQA